MTFFDPQDAKHGFDSKRQAHVRLLEWRIKTAQLRLDNLKGIEQANAARKNTAEAQRKLAEETRQRALGVQVPQLSAQEKQESERIAKELHDRYYGPNRTVSCPACGYDVQLVSGKLPTQHVYVHVDPEKQFKEKRTCNPYGQRQA